MTRVKVFVIVFINHFVFLISIFVFVSNMVSTPAAMCTEDAGKFVKTAREACQKLVDGNVYLQKKRKQKIVSSMTFCKTVKFVLYVRQMTEREILNASRQHLKPTLALSVRVDVKYHNFKFTEKITITKIKMQRQSLHTFSYSNWCV